MTTRCKALALLAFLGFLGLSAGVAQAAVYDYVRFTLPYGWRFENANGAGVLRNESRDDTAIWIFTNQGTTSDLNNLIQTFMQNDLRSETVVSVEGPATTTGWPEDAVSLSTTSTRDGATFYRYYVATAPAGTGTVFVFVGGGPEAFQTFAPEAQAVFNSVRFTIGASASQGTPALAGDGGLHGLFAGFEQRGWINPYTRLYEVQQLTHVIYFSPDGRYLNDAPDPANTSIDWQRECAARETYDCGRYTVADGKLTMRGDDGAVQSTEIEIREDGYQWGAAQLWRVPPSDPAFPIGGHWTAMGSFQTGDGSGVTGMAMSGTEFIFSGGADGTFTTESASASTVIGAGGTSSSSAGQGTYSFKPSPHGGASLVLTDSAGKAETARVVTWPGSPDAILINGRQFFRQ
jgi:hypothetical protein